MLRPKMVAAAVAWMLLVKAQGGGLMHHRRLRGAVREIGDVGDKLTRVEQVESDVEKDLKSLLNAFQGNGTAPEHAPRLALILGEHLSNMRRDLASLVKTINATRLELSEARDAVSSTEKKLEEARWAERRAKIAERLRDGKATVDYETGEVATLLSPSERRNVGAFLGSQANLSRLEQQLLSEAMHTQKLSDLDMTTEEDQPPAEGDVTTDLDDSVPQKTKPQHGFKRFDRARLKADPAMLHLDTRFLQDMVVLSLATAIGGLSAAALGAPHTLGYMMGGGLVGPSCLDLVRNLEQTETLAQFGSIFLLFSHGLMYSSYYGHRKKRRRRKADADASSAAGPSSSTSSKRQVEDDDMMKKKKKNIRMSSPLLVGGGGSEAIANDDDEQVDDDFPDDDDDATVPSASSSSPGTAAGKKKKKQIPAAIPTETTTTTNSLEIEEQPTELWAARRAFSAGFVLVAALGSAFAMAARVSGAAGASAEAALYSAAFSLSSSSTVLSSLRDARLEDTVFGHTVVELLSVQDLVLAPLLALPTAVSEFGRSKKPPNASDITRLVASYTLTVAFVVFAARRLLPKALGALSHDDDDMILHHGTPQINGHHFPSPGIPVTSPTATMLLDTTPNIAHRRVLHRTQSPPGPSVNKVTFAAQNMHSSSFFSSGGQLGVATSSSVAAARQASFGLCVAGYALAMALVADRLKLSHEAGALFAGLVLVGTPHVDRARRAVEPLTALFGGMYVASLGLVASPRYLRAHAGPLVTRVSAVLALKLAVVATVVFFLGFSRLAAISAGAVFAQVSEVALFVNARAHRLHLVKRATYLDVLSSTVVLLAIAPLAVHVLRRVDPHHFVQLETRDGEYRSPTPATTPKSSLMACLRCLFCRRSGDEGTDEGSISVGDDDDKKDTSLVRRLLAATLGTPFSAVKSVFFWGKGRFAKKR